MGRGLTPGEMSRWFGVPGVMSCLLTPNRALFRPSVRVAGSSSSSIGRKALERISPEALRTIWKKYSSTGFIKMGPDEGQYVSYSVSDFATRDEIQKYALSVRGRQPVRPQAPAASRRLSPVSLCRVTQWTRCDANAERRGWPGQPRIPSPRRCPLRLLRGKMVRLPRKNMTRCASRDSRSPSGSSVSSALEMAGNGPG